jgi:hypothetical protein
MNDAYAATALVVSVPGHSGRVCPGRCSFHGFVNHYSAAGNCLSMVAFVTRTACRQRLLNGAPVPETKAPYVGVFLCDVTAERCRGHWSSALESPR